MSSPNPSETADSQSSFSEQGPSASPTSPSSGIRWWPALVILAVYALVIASTWYIFPGLDTRRGWQVVITYISTGLAILSLVAWEMFFARIKSPAWGRIQLSLLVIVAAVVATVRPTNPDGDAWFGWKFAWEQDPHETLKPDVRLAAADDDGPSEVAEPAVTDYPGFLGANRDAVVRGVKLNPDWEAHPPRELWRIGVDQQETLGAAFSSFAIVGDRAYTQEMRGEAEFVSCFRLQTGELLWRSAQAPDEDESGLESVGFQSVVAGDGPRGTPTVHAGRVFAMGSTGVLSAFDAVTGKPLWSADVFQQAGATNMKWGNACSPLVVGKHVIVSAGGVGDAQLYGYLTDPSTVRPKPVTWGGETTGGGDDFYVSPTLRTICGMPQVLHVNNRGLSAFDANTLDVLWTHKWTTSLPVVAQPVVLPDDHVLISAAYQSGNTLIKVARDESGDFSTEEVWTKTTLKSKFANIVAIGDYAYGLDARILTCINWRTGEREWKVRAGDYGHGQILLVDNIIVVQAESGDVALVKATPEHFEQLARMPSLTDKTWNNPAISGKYLIVRNHREAVCYELATED